MKRLFLFLIAFVPLLLGFSSNQHPAEKIYPYHLWTDIRLQQCWSYDECFDSCFDKFWACEDRCGPNSEGTSCQKKCLARRSYCIDKCPPRSSSRNSSSQGSRSVISSQTKKKERSYCYQYHDEIQMEEYKAEKAQTEKQYCTALGKYRKISSKLSRPPEVCENDGYWMSIFLDKGKRILKIISKLESQCTDSSAASTSDIEVQKYSGGITLIQK